MIITLVVAASINNAIGKNGQLLWHLPRDLKFFKNTTWGMPVVMGRKTFEAVNKPLPGRTNIVITKQPGWGAANVIIAGDLNDALQKAADTNCKETFIIGGGEIYRQTMNIANIIYMTRVHATLDGDTFFPEIDKAIWELKESVEFPADEKHAYAFTIEKWERRNKEIGK
jgi:dihydrofolate reductase